MERGQLSDDDLSDVSSEYDSDSEECSSSDENEVVISQPRVFTDIESDGSDTSDESDESDSEDSDYYVTNRSKTNQNIKMTCEEMLIADDKYAKKILTKLNECRKNNLFCDWTIEAGQVLIPAHKIVLVASCQYFQGLFASDYSEVQEKSVIINGFSADCISRLIEFIYTGNMIVNNENIQETFEAAKYLSIEEAAQKCLEILLTSISKENCVDLWRYGEKYSDSVAKQAKQCILKNAVSIFKMPYAKDFTFDELQQIICEDELIVSEVVLYHFLKHWVESDYPKRTKYISDLFKNVRIATMDVSFIRENLLQDEVLLSDLNTTRSILNTLNLHVKGDIHLEPKNSVLIDFARYRNFHRTDDIAIFADDGGLYVYDNKNCSFTNKLYGFKDLEKRFLTCGYTTYKKNFFVAGGPDNICSYYNPVFNTEQSFSPLNRTRSYFELIGVKESLYACGGAETNTIERFDFGHMKWIDGPPMNTETRINFGLTITDQALYAIGGNNQSEVELFDPRVGTWDLLKNCKYFGNRCKALTLDNSIYCFGNSSLDLFDVRTNSWQILQHYDKIPDISRWSILQINGKVIFFYNSEPDVVNYRTLDLKRNNLCNPMAFDWQSNVIVTALDIDLRSAIWS